MGWDHTAIPLTYLGHYSGGDDGGGGVLATTSTASTAAAATAATEMAASASPSSRLRSETLETRLSSEDGVEEEEEARKEEEKVEDATGKVNVDVHVGADVAFLSDVGEIPLSSLCTKTEKKGDAQEEENVEEEEKEKEEEEEEDGAKGATAGSMFDGRGRPNMALAFFSSVDLSITPVEETETCL